MSKHSGVLLVGADGYIGSNCPVKDLRGIDVKSDEDFLEFPVQGKYRTIIFLAARLGSTPEDYLYNEQLYERLDLWLQKYPNTHVIYASSAAVYGEADWPRRENELPWPINLYGKSKLSGEYHIREYKNHTALRFGNVYGRMAGQEGHGVTELFEMGSSTIYGDGLQVRDFVPVQEIWRIIRLAIDYPKHWHGVFNLSRSQPVTINDWYRQYGHGDPTYTVAREGDIYTSILDNTKMKDAVALCQ